MNYSNNFFFQLFPSIIPVKGYKRSTLIDTGEEKIYYISDNHYMLLKTFGTQSIKEVVANNGQGENLLDFLIDKNLGQILEKEQLNNFIPINEEIHIPFISNSIIDIDIFNFDYVKVSIQKLSDAKIANIQFRFLSNITYQNLEKLTKWVESFSFYSIEFLISHTLYSTMSEENISYLEKCQVITKIFVFASKSDVIQRTSKFFFLSSPLNEYNVCGHTSIKYFSSFLETVLNSKKYNSCLNCKISIDKNGQVKNCPSMVESYGDIHNVSLSEVQQKKSFQKFNKITKDDIDVCKDCEFRYVCSDCRAYTDNPNNIYSRPSKCTYNPYICKWEGEEGYQTLEESGVISNENEFSIDHEKIATINEKLWIE